MHRRAFTLIELLVVIAIVAILAIVVVLVLNPAQLLMQARDSNRLADLASIQSSIGYYLEDQTSGSIGNASTTYISIPDPSATSTLGDQCQGLSLASLPTSTSWQCAPASTSRQTNGTGWLPVNLSAISVGSPLGQLPQDPMNTSSSGDYYAYIAGSANTYELIARLESAKYGSASGPAGTDGGYSASYLEMGKDLTLALTMSRDLNRVTSTDYLTFDTYGLSAYWPLNEGAGISVVDQSGNNASGTWSGTPAGTSGYYSAGKTGNWAGVFNGTNDRINLGSPSFFQNLTGPFTIAAWVNIAAAPGNNVSIFSNSIGYQTGGLVFGLSASGGVVLQLNQSGTSGGFTSSAIPTGAWQYVVGNFNGASTSFYLNGNYVMSASSAPAVAGGATYIGYSAQGGWSNDFAGTIDDVRLYNRALSQSEIQAIYNAEK